VPVTCTQQLVEQSEFCVQVLWHASAPVPSNVEHAKPLQHCRVPPHVSPSPAHWQRIAAPQKPLFGMFANGMQQPLAQSAAVVHSSLQPA
jgi:hypothetical protein